MRTILDHYGEIMTDPAHLMAEGTFIVLIDFVLLGALRPFIKRFVRREHLKIDDEHGVVDHGAEQPPAFPEFMYVEFPDGTLRRCKTTPNPTYGFPTTPGLSDPAWEIVTEPEPAR